MQRIWHDNDSSPVAMAAAPHRTAIREGAVFRRRVALIRCIAQLEVARHDYLSRGIEYKVPAGIREGYEAPLARLPELISACMGDPWDSDMAFGLAGALGRRALASGGGGQSRGQRQSQGDPR